MLRLSSVAVSRGYKHSIANSGEHGSARGSYTLRPLLLRNMKISARLSRT